jgi:cyclin T
MNFANDSMHTSLCLQFDPQHVATACVFLAAQFANIQPNSGVDWLDALGQPDIEMLASIAYQILELIAERKGAEESIFAKIRKDLQTLQVSEGHADVSKEADSSKRPRLA